MENIDTEELEVRQPQLITGFKMQEIQKLQNPNPINQDKPLN